jgi:hypothetical protein
LSVEKFLASVTEVNNSNDIYMTIDVLLLTSRVNLNGAKFLPDFIHEIVENKEFYIGMPLVCEQEKLEKGKYKNLGHALRKDGTFATQQIGSYVDFYEKQDDDDKVWSLHGTVKVFKRFKKVCNAILELFNDGNLFFSVEAYVSEYGVADDDVREIASNEGNKLFGDCIVSFPAEVKSVAETIIAEALISDLGGEDVKKIETIEEFFENTKFRIENSELDLNQIQKKLYNQMKEKIGEDYWMYDCTDMGADYVIMQDYSTGDYYKSEYKVIENDVTISDLVKVTKNYVPIVNSNGGDDVMTLAEVTAKLETAELMIKDLEKSISEKDKVIAEKETIISEKETALTENEAKLSELSESVNKLSESVVLKDNEIAELSKIKEELDKINAEKAEIEKAQKVTELKDRYSKLLDEATLALPEVSEAIEGLNESVLQAKVVESALLKISNEKPKDTVVASKLTDDISMGKTDIVSKYITINN